ncbi:histone H1-delta-like [Haliotis cracherodii]|uniref:histone H1-delta-like n=1 Tax=Haliotis cracherodii TaxID=6455 RepID=UPI0039EB4169
MTDAAPAPAKKAAKKAAPKKPSSHPKYSEMIRDAISGLKERGGSSRQALLKYIMKNFKVGPDERTVNNHLKLALRAGVKNGSLKQSKGTGASGSFRLGDKTEKAKKPKAKKATKAAKPKADKAKKTAKKSTPKKAKKPKPAKKSPAKKAAKPKAAKKSPAKKAAKPKAAKKSPKKKAAAKK